MRKDTVPPRPKDMMESLTPEQRQAIFQKAKQVEKSAQQIQQEKQVQTKRRNQALASSMMFSGDADNIIPGISNKQVKTLGQEKQEQTVQQKKLVKRTAQGTVKKAITTEYGTFDYEASPEESKILELGGQEANDLLVKIANYYRDEFKKQNVPIKESRKGFADLWEAGLNPESVDVQGQLRTNLKETFAPYTPLLPRLALEKVAGVLGSKGQELLQSENMAAKGAGLVTSIGGSIAEDLSNPLATFAYDTGNLYDPTATAEEKGGAAFNVVAKYALPAMTPLGAAQAGINAFKAGQTVEQALSTASRVLLRSSLGALGRKIDTAVYSKVPLNKLLDVLEAEGQMMGKTRAALSKELATAGKKYAKETGKGVDEFYTKYLNDYADNKTQLTSPGRVPPPIIEPVKAPEAPTQVEPEIPTQVESEVITTPEPAPTVTPVVEKVFDWSNPANEQAVRDALYAYRKQQYPNASEKILQENVDSRIANLKDNPDINPFARFSENDEWLDIRNNQATSPLWTDVQTTPTPTLFTWDAPGVADEARTALTNYLKQRLADKNYSDEYIQNLVNNVIAKRAKGVDDNPFFIEIVNKETGTTQIIDPRTGQPTKKLLSELQAPTQVEDLGTVVDELIGKTEPVVAEPTAPVVEPPVAQEPVVQITETNRQRYNAIADADDAWLEEYFTRKMDSRQAGFNLDDYEAMARMARRFAIKYGYNNIDDAIKLIVKTWKERTGIDINLTDADTQAIKQSIAKLESNASPVTPPTSIVDEIEQGMGASKSTAPPPSTEPTVTGVPETPEPITSGISNKANLSSEELGLISEAPQSKGRSASQVVEETINRNPSDKELEILAGKVANGQALNADDTAVLLVGQGRFNLRVFNAREALDNAIKSGASAQDIDQLRDAWLLAQADATNFAKQIQKGKSGWSDVGRVLQQKTDLFTGELSQIKANIIAEAELRKGRTLTDAEQENYKTMIDKLIGENKKLEEELAKLKATRSQATREGRVRRTRTLDNLDKSIAQKENKIRVNKATVTQKLNNEIPVATSTRLGQFITEMKLLNPFSRFTDVESNTIKLIDNIVSTPFNMAVDQATSRLLKTQPVYSSSYLAKDRWKNLLINSWEKMKADLKIVAAGGDVETIEKYGGAQGLGSKAAGFTDVPFKAIYHEDGKFLAADVKAREMLTEELGKGNFGKRDIDAKRTEILENIEQYPDIIMNAEEYALNETFNNHNWVSEINKAVKGTVFKSPNARLAYDELIGRFSKVITNVAIDVADRTGLGVARGIYNIADAMKSGKNLTTAERMAINKMITKGMIGMPLMYLGIKNWDKIQGEIRGIQQKYIDYGDLGKLGGPIAIFLHGASIGRAMNELPPDKVNAFVTASSVKLPFNTPFVSNIADISDILDNPAPQALAKFAAKKLSNAVIPAVIREIATRMDTEKGIQTGMEPEREKAPKGASTAEIFKGEFMSKIPGLRQQLPLKGSGRQPVTPGVIP